MFNWLKKLFGAKGAEEASAPVSTPAAAPAAEEKPKLPEKPCQACGKPIPYDPAWKHIPNYCKECRDKFDAEKGIVRRKCRSCGKTFTVPNTVKHMPNYCKACRAKFKNAKQ